MRAAGGAPLPQGARVYEAQEQLDRGGLGGAPALALALLRLYRNLQHGGLALQLRLLLPAQELGPAAGGRRVGGPCVGTAGTAPPCSAVAIMYAGLRP